MAPRLDRAQVLALRAWVQGLHGTVGLADLDALTVGLQDTPAGSAALALRQRTAGAEPVDQPDLVQALTVRGAPHLHRRADLPLVRAALRPRDNQMLHSFLGGFGDTLVAAGADGPALLDLVARELRAVFPGDTARTGGTAGTGETAGTGDTAGTGGIASKGELSGAVTPRVPEVARPWCASCGVAHVADGLFRLATLHAGLELVPGDGRRLVFRMSTDPPAGEPHDAAATARLLRAAVRLAGPLALGDLVSWLDTRAVTSPPGWLRPVWADLTARLVEVEVDGVTLHADAEAIDALGDVPAPPPVLLLPPRDLYLLGHRPFLVPDRGLARELWRPVGSPGAVVVAGEPAGTWRARKSGRTLRLTVSTARELTARQRKALETQADVVAAARHHEGAVAVAVG
jgi:hypothetical protein